MSIELIQASAHHLPMIPDESVHTICCSPPYFSLRAYSGEQSIEWPTVEYAPMPGLPMLRVQGCEPGCEHEWDTQTIAPQHGDDGITGSTLGGGKATQAQSQRQPISSAYCRRCGGWRGGLGLEPDIFSYIGHLMLCLREWRRVLRSDGTAFINLGDSYAQNSSGAGGPGKQWTNAGTVQMRGVTKPIPSGLKPKDLCLIPFRFALAAQADGWWVRADIIGAKTAPMPESCRDRPTRSHEHIFLLAKSQNYYYDAEAVREASAPGTIARFANGGAPRKVGKAYHPDRNAAVQNELLAGRNLRDVIEWRPQPFPGAHFATFCERIPEIAILAGSSAYGCCPQCGKGYVRQVEREPDNTGYANGPGGHKRYAWHVNGGKGSSTLADVARYNVETLGWAAACTCDAGEPIPATVLDPFHGSGTTGKVALRLGRNYIGVDLSQTYLDDITAQRLGDGIQMEMSL